VLFVRTSGVLVRCTINPLLHSINVFLDHVQMDPESLQIDFERAANLERPHGRVNFSDSGLILGEAGPICALIEFAFEIS